MKSHQPFPVSARGDQVAAKGGANASGGLLVEPRRESLEKGFGRCKAKFDIRHPRREHPAAGWRNQSQVATNACPCR